MSKSADPTLRLYIHPGTSGLAPHMALLADGAVFDLRTIDLFSGGGRTAEFLQLNPFGTVPVLDDGDAAIPETGAILLHVAERFPDAGLLPRGGAGRTQGLRWLFHAAALHADFMTWRRSSFALRDDPHAMGAAQDWMARRLADAFRTTDRAMIHPFLTGNDIGIADYYLFMVAGWWRKRFDFAAETPGLAACLQAMADTPPVAQAYDAQGSVLPRFVETAPA